MNNIHIPRPVAQTATHQAQFKCSNAAFPAIRHQKHVTENIWSITLTNCDTVVTTAAHILLLLLLLLLLIILLTVYYLTQNKITTVKYQPFLKFEDDAVLSMLIGVNYVISGSLPPRHGASSGCGWRNGLQYGGWLRIYWISSRG